MAPLLLEKSAHVNGQGGEYGNSLQAASAEGHERIVRLLLEMGVDINAKGGEGSGGTPQFSCAGTSHHRPDTIKPDVLNPSQKEYFILGLHPRQPYPERLCQGSPTRSR
jgi:hypothetical protein